MKNATMRRVGILLVVVLLVSPVRGQMATWDEAFTVAENWTERVIQNKGDWGGSDWAYVVDIHEFKRGERVIGYFCDVEPVGFIVVSLRKELAPIKAYSTESNLDPNSDEGMADLLKMKMEDILNAIEEPIHLYGAGAAPHIQALLEIDYRPAWDELCGQVHVFGENLRSDPVLIDYQEGRVLLTSSWHQGSPYNSFCPVGDTTCIPGFDRSVVGCVATAAAQIMKYWSWPPRGVGSHQYFWDGDDSCKEGGTPGAGAQWLNATFSDDYNWLNMPDRLTENSDQAQIDAVAELCSEIGIAVEMDYGVEGSGANIFDMNDAYADYYRYSLDCFVAGRGYIDPDTQEVKYFSQEIWFGAIKEQINANFLIQYVIPGHSIVVDGWQEDNAGKKYHINYGWRDESKTAWYNLDEIYLGDWQKEGMILNIYPVPALGVRLADNWAYSKNQFNYRYFVQDATGINVSFSSGQNLQFLPGVAVTCVGGNIRFEGMSNDNTRLFSIKGMNQAEIRISNGGLKLYPGGSIRFH